MLVAINGFCQRNPSGPTGWSYVFRNGQWAAGGLVRGNTQVGELLAVLMLLKHFPDRDLKIVTQSSYIIGACTSWKRSWQRNGYLRDDGTRRPNSQFIIPIHHLLDKSEYTIEFVKAPDHGLEKHPLSAQANKYARMAAEDAKQKGVEVLLGTIHA